MRPRSTRRMILTTKTSLILNVLPKEVLELILSKLENINDIAKMEVVSSFFSSNPQSSIILEAMKLRVGNYSNDLKTLAHIEITKRGIRLEACHDNNYTRNDIIVKRNDPHMNSYIGRKYTPEIKDISISRLHGALGLFDDYNRYKNNCIGRFFVAGYNGIFIETCNKHYFYGQGEEVEIFKGDIIHLAHSTGYMYRASYIYN